MRVQLRDGARLGWHVCLFTYLLLKRYDLPVLPKLDPNFQAKETQAAVCLQLCVSNYLGIQMSKECLVMLLHLAHRPHFS